MVVEIRSLNLRYTRVREEERQGTFMIGIIMVKEIIKIDKDQVMEIREYHSVVEYNMDKISEIDLGIIRTIEMVSGKDILEEI